MKRGKRRTEGKTYLGVSSPAYPALTAYVPMSSTMALTSSVGGQGRASGRAAAGVERRQADGLGWAGPGGGGSGGSLQVQRPGPPACRPIAHLRRTRGPTSRPPGLRHPPRSRRCAVSVLLARWAGWGLGIAVQCRMVSMPASDRPIAASGGSSPEMPAAAGAQQPGGGWRALRGN